MAIRLDTLERWNGYIQTTYQSILADRQWSGLRGSFYLTLSLGYSEGSIAVTNGSTAITGTGTAWSAAWTQRAIQIAGLQKAYNITFLTATTATLDRPYEDDTDTGVTYQIFQQNYALPSDVKQVTRVIFNGTAPPLIKIDHDSMLRYPISFGDAAQWAPGLDGGGDPTYKTIDLYPIPIAGDSLELEYLKVLPTFNGRNTEDYPPEWFSDDALIAGAKWLALVDLEKDASQQKDVFKAMLSQMHSQEDSKQVSARFVPSDEYNRPAQQRRNFWCP